MNMNIVYFKQFVDKLEKKKKIRKNKDKHIIRKKDKIVNDRSADLKTSVDLVYLSMFIFLT